MPGFERNLSTIDRIIRFLSGLGMMYIAYFNHHTLNSMTLSIILGLIGFVFIIVAIISSCPVYNLAGFSTYRKN